MARKLKFTTHTADLDQALSEALSDLQSLRDEVAEVRDNLEEHFGNTDRYQRYCDAVDNLDAADEEPDVPDCLAGVTVTYTTGTKGGRRGDSRAQRCSNYCAMLDAVVSACEQWLEDNPELDVHDDDDVVEPGEDRVTEDQASERTDQRSEVETFRDEVENIKSTCEGTEFPGMYG
jgi:hypothetical protein